jgi:hypothetical protein
MAGSAGIVHQDAEPERAEPMNDATYELLLDAYRRYGMSKLRREQLFAIIAHHDSKPDSASRAICAAARQALVMVAQLRG